MPPTVIPAAQNTGQTPHYLRGDAPVGCRGAAAGTTEAAESLSDM